MIAINAFDEIVDFLADYNPKKLIAFHPTEKTQDRVEFLLNKKKENTLLNEENNELEYYLMLEHIIRLAKAKALKS